MLNIVCLKHGTKYGPEYVNRLKNMISRNITVSYRFICFTDDPRGIDSDIQINILPRDKKIQGWWWKPYLFKADLYPQGDDVLFFDLDMVIIGNIDKLITFEPGKFVGLRDVGRVFRPQISKLGSAVMRWPAGEYSDIWSMMEHDLSAIRGLQGDQDWIWRCHQRNIQFFPEKWIQSYKWEVRNRVELTRKDGRQVFQTIRNPDIDPETCVLAFHGTPNPEDVQDPIIVDNWR
jgi:hypothetical protein